jgi:hypothetical protein
VTKYHTNQKHLREMARAYVHFILAHLNGRHFTEVVSHRMLAGVRTGFKPEFGELSNALAEYMPLEHF